MTPGFAMLRCQHPLGDGIHVIHLDDSVEDEVLISMIEQLGLSGTVGGIYKKMMEGAVKEPGHAARCLTMMKAPLVPPQIGECWVLMMLRIPFEGEIESGAIAVLADPGYEETALEFTKGLLTEWRARLKMKPKEL